MELSRYRPHLGALLALGLPLIGSHLARMAIGVSDTVMIGWYGVEALAALVLATAFQHLLFFLGMGYGVGVMGLIATALARGDEAELRRVTRMALWLSAIHAAVVMPLMWWSGPILLALGQEPQIAALAQDYLRIAGWGLFAQLGGLTLVSYIAALERAQVAMWVVLLGLPVNMLLNWLLIFGNWGFPEMGVRGAATASLIVNYAQLVAGLVLAALLPVARPHQLLHRLWKPDWPAFRAVFRIGMPVSLTMVAEGGLFIATNVMMGWISTAALAAHGIALQITSVSFMVPLGLSNAATVLIGKAKGRGDPAMMRDASRVSVALALAFALGFASLFLIMPGPLARLFLDPGDPQTPALVALAAHLLLFAALFQIADCLQVATLGLLRGVHDTAVPMWMAAFAYWVIGMPLAWWLAFRGGWGPAGLWLGLVAGLSLAAILLSWRFWRGLARGDWTEGARPA